MPIQHKFQQHDFGNGFETHHSILDTIPYKPEVLIVGTFNPDTPNDNHADFFYGRNYFWPAFKNLFELNEVQLTSRRMPSNGIPPAILNPTVEEIKSFCRQLKITFCDLIQEVLHQNNPEYILLPNDNVIFNEHEYNLINDGKKRNVGGLQQLNMIGQVHWNTQNIIAYLNNNPQIHSIYFTRRPTGIWLEQWQSIVNSFNVNDRYFTNLFTPSGAGAPVHRSMTRLLHHWINNTNPNFGKLNSDWLIANGVNPNLF